jgi:hypothetical protein
MICPPATSELAEPSRAISTVELRATKRGRAAISAAPWVRLGGPISTAGLRWIHWRMRGVQTISAATIRPSTAPAS